MTSDSQSPSSTLTPADASLLDALGEGVLIVGSEGRHVFAGDRLQRWPESVREQVRRACVDVLHRPDEGKGSRRFQLAAGDDHHLEVIVGRSVDAAGSPVAVAVIFDASEHRRLQRKIDAIDKAGAELVRIESQAVDAMTPAERLKVIEERVIRATRDLMNFDHFCIRLIDPNGSKLEPVLADGLPPEALDVELIAADEANGISGYVARTGRSYICHDVGRDSRYIPGLDGAQSSLTVPLTLDDAVIGVLNVESRQPAAFDEDDRQFAEIFGRYVAIALSILRLLVSERAATNKKVADEVAGEVAGPLNDIALDAQSLLDDFVGEEKLQGRLRSILENVQSIRDGMRDASRGPNVLLGSRTHKPDELADAADEPLRGAKVLVVDDESSIRDTVAAVLKKYKATVVTCCTGREAIAALPGDFDLILSDIRMPDHTGYDVFAAARNLPSPPPVILMTGFGYDPNHCIVRASQEGLHAVLFKPFRVEQMLGEVRNAVRH